VALVPVAHEVDAGVTVALVGVVLWGSIAFEATRYREARARIRHEDHQHRRPGDQTALVDDDVREIG
jgi:hypothetical protein